MNRRILFVDDESRVLDAVSRLAGNRYEVVTATRGSDALGILEDKGPFAVVISDFSMPDMTGADFLALVRERWPDTTREMLTGYADFEVAVESLHRGDIFRFLTKPFTKDSLFEALDAGIERFLEGESKRLHTEELESARDSLVAVTRALEERIDKQMGALQTLQQLASRLESAESIEGIAGIAVNAASDVLGRRGVEIELWDKAGESEPVQLRAGPPISGAIKEEQIHTGEGTIGRLVVDLLGHSGEELTETDLKAIDMVVSSTAVAAQNQIRRHERDQAQQATVLALARLAEYRDNETGRHLDRVSEYCRAIAEGLRARGRYVETLSDSYIDDLARSAPLHDIGKVGIPDSILLKPGKLTEEEWVVMRQHTIIGAETLRKVMEVNGACNFLQLGLEIAWCHHERWDGTGYPRKLAAQEIPLSARIVALADCYDALTSVRPYKEAWSHERAMDLIQDSSGTHFDPELVEVFAERRDEVERTRERLADE